MTALSTQEPFHFYAVTKKGASVAFNMENFGKKIAVALEKVKVKIAKEYNLTVEEVEYVIEKNGRRFAKTFFSCWGSGGEDRIPRSRKTSKQQVALQKLILN